MHPEDIDQVWAGLDRRALAEATRAGPEPVFATLSGAHLYGFASPDSDVDLRGAFLLPAQDLLGLKKARETLTVSRHVGALELDWVAHDLRKFVRMLTQHNGYVLEQLYSPLVVIGGPALDELRTLALGCVTRKTVRHFLGFAHGRRERLLEPKPTVKHLLYAYRVYLTGIHAMRTGQIESNLTSLNEVFGLPFLTELVARKRGGAERMQLGPEELFRHDALLDGLEQQLQAAHEASRLPEEPTSLRELDAFVIRLRLERLPR